MNWYWPGDISVIEPRTVQLLTDIAGLVELSTVKLAPETLDTESCMFPPGDIVPVH